MTELLTPPRLPVETEAMMAQQPEFVARHRRGPIGQRGPNFFDINKHARITHRPKHIITADSPYPKEIDDGVFVEELPSATEMYRVGVCLPDTSRLYLRHDVLRPAIAKLHANYGIGEDGLDYSSLIDEDLIRTHEMSQGNWRKAMILRFIVGQNHPPSDASVSFERVYVDRNLDYRQFSEQTGPSAQYERYARAGHYIMQQLRYVDSPDAAAITQADTLEMVQHLIKQQPERLHMAGSLLTSVYMLGTNHIAGLLLDGAERQEGGERKGIYRVFDPENIQPQDFIPANMARFSMSPGRHAALQLSKVLQVTSPLRRIQDGINGAQLWKLWRGLRQDNGDLRVLEDTTQLLNYEIAMKHKRKLLRRYQPELSPEYVEADAHASALEVVDSLSA